MNAARRLLVRSEGPPIVPLSGWSATLTTLVAAAMSFLAVLTLTAALAAERLAESWRGNLDGAATVQVTAPQAQLAERVERALAVLDTAEGVARARLLTDTEHEALISPWIGDGVEIGALPAPRVIALTLAGDGPDTARLQARLDAAAPGARYDDHDAWRAPLLAAAARLGLVARAGTLLVALAAAATVALAVQATLSAHSGILRLVRLVGGEDRFIAGAFVRRLTLRGLAGGLIGAGLAGGLLATLPPAAETGVAVALLPEPAALAGLLAGVALGTAAVAWVTATVSLRRALRAVA